MSGDDGGAAASASDGFGAQSALDPVLVGLEGELALGGGGFVVVGR